MMEFNLLSFFLMTAMMANEGHTWFRKGWGHDLNSSELIWEFFKDK